MYNPFTKHPEEEAGESESSEDGIAAGLTEEQINELIAQGLANQDMTGYATQEDIQGLESLFQNYLTPEQLEGYLPQDQAETITALENKIADLEQQAKTGHPAMRSSAKAQAEKLKKTK